MGTKAGTWRWSRAGARGVTALLVCGVVVGPLFMIVSLIEGATRADYDPLRHSISSLVLGSDFGWIQTLNFIVAGLLSLAFAGGVRGVLGPEKAFWKPLLIALWAVGLLGAGIFVTDPDAGYPPGTPAKVADPTMHGMLHNWFTGLGFPALLAAFIVFARWFAARGERGWALYSAASAAVFIVFVGLHNYTSPREEGFGVELSGLFQRIAVASGWGWLSALALYLLIRRPPEPAVTLES